VAPTGPITALEAALSRLRAGELVVIPTETVYGLAADAENSAAVAKIFALKGRPPSRPLIVHISGSDQLDRWACKVPDYARALAQAFWPGPMSLVLPRSSRVPDAVTGGQDTVALRVPAHPLIRELLKAFGGGLAAPSANRYGRISPTTPGHVRGQFGRETPLLLDGGPCSGGIESTIIGCLEATPRILRPGLIPASEIAAAVGLPVQEQTSATENLRTAGQDTSHYAPTTPAFLLPRGEFAAWREVHSGRVGFLGFEPPGVPVELDLRLPSDAAAAARTLYGSLHQLDAAGLEALLIEAPPAIAAWAGVRDRLQRAAAGPKAPFCHGRS
jgi:L-threonylcarbamoyladenylate synthase